MRTITGTTMNERSLLRLATWFSAAFPIGGFAWSGGLETACREGTVETADDLRGWIETALQSGWMRNDAILLASAHEGAVPITEINALAVALASSNERHKETCEQGEAFLRAAGPWVTTPALPGTLALPVAAGAVCKAGGIALRSALIAFLQSAVSQQVQAALRLMPLGQNAAMRITSELEPVILAAAERANRSTLDDLGSCAVMMDIAAMRHEELPSRIFRS